MTALLAGSALLSQTTDYRIRKPKPMTDLTRWNELDVLVLDYLDGRALTPEEMKEYRSLSASLEATGWRPNCPCHGAQGEWLGWDAQSTGAWGDCAECPGCTDEHGIPLPVAERLTLAERIGVMNSATVLDSIEDFEEATVEAAR